MVPVIDPPTANLGKVLNYNEKKVQRGVAELLQAANFLKPAEELNFHDKLQRFGKLNELNERAEKSTLHISLNFHPDDQLTKEQLCEIAAIYMERIGMGNQPYLIYQHHDSGHPHIHLVTTLIRPNGVRISTNNMGKNQSTEARKEIDKLYGLHKVEDSQHQKVYEPEPVNAQKVIYGNLETKKAIKDVLRFVLKKYKFTSLPELNAVLQQYNVLADRGATDSRTYRNGGLVYRILDEHGSKIGVPIKASDFHFKPTLKALQEKFEKNGPLRKADIPGIRGRIDWTLGKQPKSFQPWIEELKKENIRVVIRRNDEGVVYGLTYVDFKTRSVLNGSDLGKTYSAQAITQRFNSTGPSAGAKTQPISQSLQREKPKAASKKRVSTGPATAAGKSVPTRKYPRKAASKGPEPLIPTLSPTLPMTGEQGNSLLQDLLAELPQDQIPYELTIDQKKRKKKRLRQ